MESDVEVCRTRRSRCNARGRCLVAMANNRHDSPALCPSLVLCRLVQNGVCRLLARRKPLTRSLPWLQPPVLPPATQSRNRGAVSAAISKIPTKIQQCTPLPRHDNHHPPLPTSFNPNRPITQTRGEAPRVHRAHYHTSYAFNYHLFHARSRSDISRLRFGSILMGFMSNPARKTDERNKILDNFLHYNLRLIESDARPLDRLSPSTLIPRQEIDASHRFPPISDWPDSNPRCVLS
jgi:hypothetical protein